MTMIEDLLAQNQVFGVLTPIRRAEIARLSISRRLRKGEILLSRGDIWPYLFIIASGTLSAQKESSEGRNLIITSFTPGDIFWGLGFFYDEMPMIVTLRAVETTHIYVWSRDSLLPYIKESGELSWELCRLMVTKMARASEILEMMSFQPVAGRLAKLLAHSIKDDPEALATRSLTLEEMAARIGTTREMVCRFLHRFADEGIIDITRTDFRVVNQKRLADMAQNEKG